MKKGKFRQALGTMSLALASLFVFGACTHTPSNGGETQLDFDTRGLTAQEYSVANLTAVDDYGRTVTVIDPSDESRRYVGLFYFTWLGSQGMTGIYDVNKLEQLGADSPLYDTDDATGASPTHQFHFMSEPLYGYYSLRDPWVIARHVELLTMAGIDYILFDYTNSVTYNDVVTLILQTLDTYRLQGWDVPKVGFYTNTASAATIRNIYNTFYVTNQYNDLWFRFEGDSRPVIVGVSTANGGASDQTNASQFLSTSDPLYSYFNFYESQWPSTGVANDEKGLPWLQWGTPVPNMNGNISVSVAQHSDESPYFSEERPTSSRGYDGYEVHEDWWLGQNFDWQWDNALTYADAGMVQNIFVTGWNEWTAIKYITKDDQGGADSTSGWTGRDVFFVDGYNAEYSRDIEMGKAFGDSFYLQMVSGVRTFKGNEAKKYRMATKTIEDLSDLTAWDNVFVEYADFAGDAMPRNGENAAREPGAYVDNSNRNDITSVKVIHDDTYVYFRVETLEPVTEYASGDEGWMNLLISAGDTETSFAGFNYIVNRHPGENGKTSVEKCSESGFNWAEAGEAEIYRSENTLVYKIPLSALGMTADNVSFSFKVADNVQFDMDKELNSHILDYYISGDSAPIGRFGFAYNK